MLKKLKDLMLDNVFETALFVLMTVIACLIWFAFYHPYIALLVSAVLGGLIVWWALYEIKQMRK